MRLPLRADARQWFASLVLATLAALYVIAGLSVTVLAPAPDFARADVPHLTSRLLVPGLGTPPTPPPLQFRDVSPQDAAAINAAIPISDTPNPAARPFAVAFATPADQARALDCLTAAVYYEAASEPIEGERAVAQVVLNRVRHPAFPKSVCGVVFQGSDRSTGCQFTFTCDGALARIPSAAGWARARQVAADALGGKVFAPVGWSTHYHTNWVVPYWSATLVKDAIVGTQIFYRWEGGWGRSPAFRFAASGGEPQIALMRRLASDPSTLADVADQPIPLADAALTGSAALVPVVANGKVQLPAVRHYEPMSSEAATAAAVARAAPGQKPATVANLQWALSGVAPKPQTPLGRRVETDAPTAATAPAAAVKEPPHCLDGVRRMPAAGQGATEKQTC